MLDQVDNVAAATCGAGGNEAEALHHRAPDAVIERSPPGSDSIVGIVLAEAGNERLAMTTASFAEAAHHPCSLWVAIEKASRIHSLIERSGAFSLAILHARQHALARFCNVPGGRTLSELQQQGASVYVHGERYLFLADAITANACGVRQSYDFDDRTLFIADITACHVDSRRTHLRQLLLSELSGV
jgi:flavin reductase (DIM6/NTAB) family NADH-FMN oxidoreductase RutF